MTECRVNPVDGGPLGRELLCKDGHKVLLLKVRPLGEPGKQVVHLLVVRELCPLVADPSLQHPGLAGGAGHAVAHGAAHS